MQQYRMDRGLLQGFLSVSLLLIVSVLILFALDSPRLTQLSVKADQGIFPLTFWFPKTSEPLPLVGNWQGYPDQLLTPKEAAVNIDRSVATSLPDIWLSSGPRRHVMTYTLRLDNVPQDVDLALFVPELKSSFRLFIDEYEIASGGATTSDRDQVEGYFGDKIVELGLLPRQVRITLQVANYGHARGGVQAPLVIGTKQYWKDYYQRNILVEGVVICLAILAGTLMLFEFYLVRTHKELLWISLFSFALAGYVGTTGLGSFATLIPSFPWWLAIRLEHIGLVIGLPLFLNWLTALYPESEFQLQRWLFGLACLWSGFIILSPTSLFTALLYPELLLLIVSALMIGWLLFKLVRAKRSAVHILLMGTLVLIFSILHEIAVFLGLVQSEHYLSYGVLFFLVSQIGFLTFYRTQEQLRILDLNRALQGLTQQLKNTVSERNEALELQLEELEKKKERYQYQLSHDDLTGLLNRHHFLHTIEQKMIRSRQITYSIMVIDLDHYKQISDTHGRDFAEDLLCRVARLLVRTCDGHFDWIPARFGGDEFVLWLGAASQKEAERIALLLEQEVARTQIPLLSQPGEFFRFNIAIGIANSTQQHQNIDDLLACAADQVHLSRKRTELNYRKSTHHKMESGNAS